MSRGLDDFFIFHRLNVRFRLKVKKTNMIAKHLYLAIILVSATVFFLVLIKAFNKNIPCPVVVYYSGLRHTSVSGEVIYHQKFDSPAVKLYEPQGQFRINRISISRNGKYLAFFSSNDIGPGDWKLNLMDLKNNCTRNIIEWNAGLHGVPWETVWDINGKRIAFFAGSSIWIVNMENGEASEFRLSRRFLLGNGRIRHDAIFPPLQWKSNGTLLSGIGAVILKGDAKSTGTADLESFDRSGPDNCERTFTSPDGKLSATYNDCMPGCRPTVALYNQDGTIFKKIRFASLSYMKQCAVGFPKWTSDSRFLAIPIKKRVVLKESAQTDLYIIDVKTGRKWRYKIPLILGVGTWDIGS